MEGPLKHERRKFYKHVIHVIQTMFIYAAKHLNSRIDFISMIPVLI
jgi:hypothetical protein